MTDAFQLAKSARKKRTKFWREHIPLSYAVLTVCFAAIYFGVALVSRRMPGWLTTLGVSPSGVNLLLGTVSCGFGIWGIRESKDKGIGWMIMNVLCLLGGIMCLAKAFAFV